MEDYLTIEEAAAAADVGVSTLNKYCSKKYISPTFGRPVGAVGRGKRRRLFTWSDVKEIQECRKWLLGEPRRAILRRWAK